MMMMKYEDEHEDNQAGSMMVRMMKIDLRYSKGYLVSLTSCWSRSGSKIFAKVISKQY